MNHHPSQPRKVIIIGGGFGGLQTAKKLDHPSLRVTLIDKENHHLFQPLLYQVATAGLVPGQIAFPIRSALRKKKHTQVLLAEVEHIDFQTQRIFLQNRDAILYDYLVISCGTVTNYFGHDDWKNHSVGLKDIRDSLKIREQILSAFEKAEMNPEKKKKLLSFIVIGGGPTGVELAGAISELGKTVLAKDFKNISANDIQVTLIEGSQKILNGFDDDLSAKAVQSLESLGVKVKLNCPVERIEQNQVFFENGCIEASVICWATGVKPTSLINKIKAKKDKAGRIIVNEYCQIPEAKNVFVIGDAASFVDPKSKEPLPGLAPVAIQQGRYIAHQIEKIITDKKVLPFKYVDKGIMATIGRSRAVVQSKGLKMTGFIAWLTWIFVHIWFLIGFKNKVFVLLEWFWAFVTFRRGSRLITSRDVLLSNEYPEQKPNNKFSTENKHSQSTI